MASRGRGRGGAGSSFSMEQLGFAKGETLPGPVLQPPPIFPKLEHVPVPLRMDPELEYLLTLKRDFVDFVRDSPSYLRPTKPKTDIERYSDRYQTVQPELKLHWPRFPTELRPQSSKRKANPAKAAVASKKAKSAEAISSRLEELEKVERKSDDEEEPTEKKEGEDGDDEEVEEEEVDEEMDDGTDYVNNYFDDGDGYLDDDDDMDDGPVY